MIATNDYLFISYDPNDRFKKILPGGIELIVPDRWEYVDEYGQKNGKLEDNINKLDTNPQIGYVLVENPSYKFKRGDKIFFHYLAIRYACNVEGQDGAFISADDVFFTDNGEIEMCDGIYLGEQVYDDIPRTESGIYLEHIERKVEKRIVLTNVPASQKKFKAGDTVISVDGSQYILTYNGKKYVKLEDQYIVAKIEDNKLIPIPCSA